MGLAQHNADRLEWWLNADFPDRIAGRFNSEQPMEARQLESRVIIKNGALNRIDAHFQCEQEHETPVGIIRRTPNRTLSETDAYLLNLFFEWLPEQGPSEIYYKAARQVLLSDSAAGGIVELERLEKMGEEGYIVTGEVASLARKAFELILEKTVEDGYRLDVERDERARTKMQAYHQDRGEVADVRRAWVTNKFTYYRTERRMSQPAAVKRLCIDYRRSPQRVRDYLRGTPLWDAVMAWEREEAV